VSHFESASGFFVQLIERFLDFDAQFDDFQVEMLRIVEKRLN
jgi:hypothetical protein